MTARPAADVLAAIVAAYARLRRAEKTTPPTPWKAAARLEATLARQRAGRRDG